jgi:hypothetical protein
MVDDDAASPRPLERRANEQRALDRLRYDDLFAGYSKILI